MTEKEGLIRAALPSPLSPLRGAAPNGFASKLCSKQSLSNLRFSSHPRSPNKKGAPWAPFLFGWRRRRDSNPRYAINVYSLSRGAPSATRPLLRILLLTPFDVSLWSLPGSALLDALRLALVTRALLRDFRSLGQHSSTIRRFYVPINERARISQPTKIAISEHYKL